MPRQTHSDSALLKKQIIERLAQGYGIMETCDLVRIARNTYYNWKKADPAFAADVERILRDPIHTTRIMKHESKAVVGIEDDWKLRFLGVYKKTGDRNQALMHVGEGKRAQEIEAAMDPNHPDYDAQFAKAFINEEQKRLWQIEDNTLRKAEHDMPTARFVLGNLVKHKYGKLEGSTTIQQAWFSAKGEDEAANTLRGLNFGQSETKPKEPLDSGPEYTSFTSEPS